MNALEPACASKLGQTFGVVHVTLVNTGRQYAFGMAGADALDRDAPLGQAMVQERRKRAGLQHNADQSRAVLAEPLRKHVGIASDNVALQNIAIGHPPALKRQRDFVPFRRVAKSIMRCLVSRLRPLPDPDRFPALDAAHVHARPAFGLGDDQPRPRVLLLYGSLRERSYSRLAVEEAARLLQLFGAETRIFDPADLPLPDQVKGDDHPAVDELREHASWSEGMAWCSPERHGQISAIMKAQIDHLPLNIGGMRPTQGRTLAVMQVSGGSQSFNSVNTLRLLGRWMRMVTIPNQSSVPKAYQEFDEAGRMKPSPLYDRIVDVMEELVRFTVLMRPHAVQLVDRYSERKADGRPVDTTRDLSAIVNRS